MLAFKIISFNSKAVNWTQVKSVVHSCCHCHSNLSTLFFSLNLNPTIHSHFTTVPCFERLQKSRMCLLSKLLIRANKEINVIDIDIL